MPVCPITAIGDPDALVKLDQLVGFEKHVSDGIRRLGLRPEIRVHPDENSWYVYASWAPLPKGQD